MGDYVTVTRSPTPWAPRGAARREARFANSTQFGVTFVPTLRQTARLYNRAVRVRPARSRAKPVTNHFFFLLEVGSEWASAARSRRIVELEEARPDESGGRAAIAVGRRVFTDQRGTARVARFLPGTKPERFSGGGRGRRFRRVEIAKVTAAEKVRGGDSRGEMRKKGVLGY